MKLTENQRNSVILNLKIDEIEKTNKNELKVLSQKFEDERLSMSIQMKEELKYERGKSQSYLGQINDMLRIIEVKEQQIRS